ncbi:hypothetical protein Pelo_18574 [Pelomyxa schiedti]|nr:hypothetical protein Pelo_18574 [Pelomyxa schiedti]
MSEKTLFLNSLCGLSLPVPLSFSATIPVFLRMPGTVPQGAPEIQAKEQQDEGNAESSAETRQPTRGVARGATRHLSTSPCAT